MSRLLIVETIKELQNSVQKVDSHFHIASKMSFKQKWPPKNIKNLFIKSRHKFFRDPENGQKLFAACFELIKKRTLNQKCCFSKIIKFVFAKIRLGA